MPKKILVVDDEPDIREILSYNLKNANYKVLTAKNGLEALKLASEEKPDLVILDLMMPEMDGIETCIELRKNDQLKNMLIIFLSARSEEFSQVAAYDSGANDYITKPIKPKILIHKINALFDLIKEGPDTENQIKVGDLVIDKNKYLVFQNDQEYSLPRKEFELLSFLVSEPNRVFKRDEILSEVWGEDVVVGGRTIDVHIRKLRERLGMDKIKTVKGVGYKFQAKDP